ncbi:MAG: (2Fe-2S)-binding protein [Bacteroidetes bacterium]|nr:(2Fe-2S)-binding protein [Bacteroidota bacterium]
MVDRCICFSKTFQELKSIAERHSLSDLSALQQFVEFGERCSLCMPYVERMLQTGQTSFPLRSRVAHPFEDPELFG